MTGESVARYQWMVECRMTLMEKEEEEGKGRREDQMVEAEKGILLWKIGR